MQSEMGALAAAPSAVTAPTTVEEAAAEVAGTTATNPARTAGKASLVTALGGTSLVRTVLRATLASLRCHHRQGETTTTGKTMGWGLPRASRDRLHPRWCSGSRLSSHLHAVLPRGERGPPQA